MRRFLSVAGAATIFAAAALCVAGWPDGTREARSDYPLKLVEQWGTSDNPSQFSGSPQTTKKEVPQGAKPTPKPTPKPKGAEGSTQPQTEPIR